MSQRSGHDYNVRMRRLINHCWANCRNCWALFDLFSLCFSTVEQHPTEVPLESTRIERRSLVSEFNISTTDEPSTFESAVDETTTRPLNATFTVDTTASSDQNQATNVRAATSSIDATVTLNDGAGPALDASFDFTVHGEVEEAEVEEE